MDSFVNSPTTGKSRRAKRYFSCQAGKRKIFLDFDPDFFYNQIEKE
jgi:hypothetical protein